MSVSPWVHGILGFISAITRPAFFIIAELIIIGNAEADKTFFIWHGNLQKRHVDGNTTSFYQVRHLSKGDGDIVGLPLLYDLPHITTDEENLVMKFCVRVTIHARDCAINKEVVKVHIPELVANVL